MKEQDRLRILNMVKNGTLTVEEAEKLFNAAEPAAEVRKQTEEIAVKDPRGRKGKKFRIIVDSVDEKMKSAKVNVSIPLSIIRSVGPIIAKNLSRETKQELDGAGVDIEQIIKDIESIIDNGLDEDIVNVDTGEGEEKTKVRIYVE